VESAGTGMSFREQSAWVSLVGVVVTYGAILGAPLMGWVGNEPGDRLGFLVGAIFVQTVVMIVVQIVVAVRTPPEARDERDTAIALRSYRNAYFTMGPGVMMVIIGLIWGGVMPDGSRLLNPMRVGHVLLGCFVAAEVVRYATQGYLYRKGL
jgi:hypothetical protein